MGTLLSLDDPVGRLGRALAAAGHPAGHDRAAAALSAEIAHYRANMHRGATREGLEDLRAECAGVLAAALPEPRPSPALARELLHEALAFRLFPDAIPALRAFAAAGQVDTLVGASASVREQFSQITEAVGTTSATLETIAAASQEVAAAAGETGRASAEVAQLAEQVTGIASRLSAGDEEE
jgi:hypothetical protein